MLHRRTKGMLLWSMLTPTVFAVGMSLGVSMTPAAASAMAECENNSCQDFRGKEICWDDAGSKCDAVWEDSGTGDPVGKRSCRDAPCEQLR